MNKKELISIIIPVHNGQDYLGNCIGSIAKQACSSYDMEIIVINDGSTDATADICERLRESHENLHVIPLEDLGVSCGRNTGIDIAKGDFITFVDADDRLLPGMLEHLYTICKSGGYDFAGCGFSLWCDEEELNRIELMNFPLEVGQKTYSGNEFMDKGILSGDTRCWGKLYRRETIGEIRFKEGLTIGEDMLFLLDITLKSERINISEYKGYGYFYNPIGATWRPFTPRYMDQITCWKLAGEKISENRPDLMYRIVSNIIISIMLTVGKIALLSKAERIRYQNEIEYCRKELLETRKVPGAFGILSRGYKLKVTLFSFSPRVYIWMYGIWKR